MSISWRQLLLWLKSLNNSTAICFFKNSSIWNFSHSAISILKWQTSIFIMYFSRKSQRCQIGIKMVKCIIMSYLTKITAFFTDSKIAFLIWASEKSGMVHEISFAIICLLTTQSNPEEVVRLFTLVEYLNTESFGIVHIFDNILGNFCLLGVCVGTNPNINYTRSILWIKWNLKIADKM